MNCIAIAISRSAAGRSHYHGKLCPKRVRWRTVILFEPGRNFSYVQIRQLSVTVDSFRSNDTHRRSKHLKCDGQNPCVRCRSSGSDCIYVASRRGYKGPRKNQPQNPSKSQVTSPAPQSISGSADGSNAPILIDPGTGVASALATQRPSFSGAAGVPYETGAYPFDDMQPTRADIQLYRSYFPDNHAGISSTKQQTPPTLQSFSLADRCLDAFFYHFHASHPFVLPKPFLLTLVGDPSLEPVLAAARWNIPNPMSLSDLENMEFSGHDRVFSSFAYRVLCGRNLGRFMRTPPLQGPDDENIARIEALLTNWRLHLPQNKKDSLQKNGMLDEMMFQAHMIMHATSIMLHQPFSQLDTTPTQGIISCAPYQPVATGSMFNTHTKHTITSACAISELVTHRVPLLSHTQFFTCVVTSSSIVHLSKWAVFFVPHDDDDLRQQIRLNIGALNHLSTVWGAADRARNQVRAVARDIYQLKKQQQSNPQYWIGYSQQDMLNSMAADETIITEVENAESLQHSQHGMGGGMQ
ncbi:hypothetical protein NHJ13734_009107 [Beauveria thailandica]